jgi:CRP-like cAMP-binding protein
MTIGMVPSSRTAVPLDEPARVRAALVRAPLFASLPPVAIDDLIQRISVKRVNAQGTVVSQDEPGDAMFVIMSGRVKVVIFGENGREVTLSILRPGDAFGEMSLFDGKARSANCIAMEPTALLVLSREDLLRHMAAHPRTALNLLGEMADRLRRADESIAQLALCDVNERLVHRLISLAREEGTESPEGLMVRRRPTQQELANMIGSCRETISRAFNQLARDGMIIPRGRSLVVTRALLDRAAAKSRAA